jgi:hypothetical protein
MFKVDPWSFEFGAAASDGHFVAIGREAADGWIKLEQAKLQ